MVPVSAGKRLWWHYYTSGNMIVHPPWLVSGGFAFQVDDFPAWMGSTSGNAYLFYGEY